MHLLIYSCGSPVGVDKRFFGVPLYHDVAESSTMYSNVTARITVSTMELCPLCAHVQLRLSL